jgi:4-carboxymuconolactone decarboxylase
MPAAPKPPRTYQAFVRRYPKLAQAWELLSDAGQAGPLDEKTVRLVKLAIAIGAMREGAVHSNVRKARAMGISEGELGQVVALAASTLGMPSTVAVFSWVNDGLGRAARHKW